MQQYRVEFFENAMDANNSHKLAYRHHDFSENLMIDDDYLSVQTTVIEIGATDKVQNGQFIRILRDNDDCFFGIVTDVSPGEYATQVSFKPFIALFETDVLFDTSCQYANTEALSLENVLKDYITAYYVSNSDALQNYPIDITVPPMGQSPSKHTVSWGMNIKSDVENAQRAIIGLYGVLITNALKNFGIAINVVPNFRTGRIELTIGTVDGTRVIDADLDNVDVKTLKVNDRPNGTNKLIVYNTENFNQKVEFYAHTDHTWSLVNEDRIVPVVYDLKTATPEEGVTFELAAVQVAYDELSGLTWDNLIELDCAPNDPLVNPTTMQIGQEVTILYADGTYSSILTGKSVTFETVTLTFGSERIKYTKRRKSK